MVGGRGVGEDLSGRTESWTRARERWGRMV